MGARIPNMLEIWMVEYHSNDINGWVFDKYECICPSALRNFEIRICTFEIHRIVLK